MKVGPSASFVPECYGWIAALSSLVALFLHWPITVLSIGACGSQSIIPWLTALVTDASSHALLHKSRRSKFTSQEEQELQRRYANLILYLLRTPVYDRTVG